MSEEKKGGLVHYISQAWLVILLSIIFGASLAGVELSLKDRIENNKRDKTLRQVPKIFAGFEGAKAEEVVIKDADGKETTVLKVSADDRHVGWILPGSGPGFADKIEILVGVDTDFKKIIGIAVISQKETPGLGDYITKDDKPFRKDYCKGLSAEKPVVVVKRAAKTEDNEVQAITGATVSSEAVTTIVNKTISTLSRLIREQGGK